MYALNKGALVNIYSTAYKTLLTAVIIALFAMSFVGESIAQTSKPKLKQIILNEKTNDPEAEKIVRKLYTNWMKKNKVKGKLGNVRANFIPIQKKGSTDKFIFSVAYDEPVGGCFAKGCKTIILRSKGNNEWKGVFGAFIHNAFFDTSSTDKTPANLILTSNVQNKNPGIWMWDGERYSLVNKK